MVRSSAAKRLLAESDSVLRYDSVVFSLDLRKRPLFGTKPTGHVRRRNSLRLASRRVEEHTRPGFPLEGFENGCDFKMRHALVALARRAQRSVRRPSGSMSRTLSTFVRWSNPNTGPISFCVRIRYGRRCRQDAADQRRFETGLRATQMDLTRAASIRFFSYRLVA